MSAVLQESPLSTDIRVAAVTEDVLKPMDARPGLLWLIAFAIAVGAFTIGAISVAHQLAHGIGILGINNTVGWGVYITDFVFWVGIGHAGTLISAILFLFRQKWRTAINRAAEAMTIFAVMCAGLFPLLHIGRNWYAYWLIPYPNKRDLWVNFNSPLLWDVFAVSTYATTSAIFWYVGLIPDLATVRDRTKGLKKIIFGALSLGWKGTGQTWVHYERAYAQFAWLATPLVLSVHSIVSFDFAVSNLPGWHTTIFPPYFVAGAVFSGFGMVITLLVVARTTMKLEHLITMDHLDLCNKVILATSWIVSLAYLTEIFVAWYSNSFYERFQFMDRAVGDYAWAFWTMMFCNCVAPQVFWFRAIRRNLLLMFIISIFVNIGMWFERFNIFVISLHSDFLPTNWNYYVPTFFDWATTIGSFGMFFILFLLFCRILPVIAVAEIKSVLPDPVGKFTGKKEAN
jgi:molybdopterin-containing oxidoreductase family membrane subunit